jgi:hypothetical protein
MNYDEYISFEHQGFPVAIMPDHQDDCERWHYAIKIDHKWYDVDYGALNFDRVAADKVIAKVAKQSLEDYRKRTDELLCKCDEAKKTAVMLAGELAAARRDLILAKREGTK